MTKILTAHMPHGGSIGYDIGFLFEPPVRLAPARPCGYRRRIDGWVDGAAGSEVPASDTSGGGRAGGDAGGEAGRTT